LPIKLASLFLVLHLSCLLGAAPRASRVISQLELYDKLHGMWIGQLLGNATGRPTEGIYDGPAADPNPAVPWEIKQVWEADDDTDIEYLALHILETCGFACNASEIAEQWLEHLTADGIYVANKQAWSLMLDGYLPPDTGSRTYNQHWYSIDAQIGTEVLGALSPGLPKVAADLAGRFGAVTNSGFALHAAQFYAAMYAEAFFEPNVPRLVSRGLAEIPPTSRTTQVIDDVLDWYVQDSLDGALDWRVTREKLYQSYQGTASYGRYYNWVESTINTGATVLALLYGQGDFKRTLQIAVLAGWDCDCNPATAGGLLGIIHGFSRLPADLTDPAVCGDEYLNLRRPGLPDPDAQLPQSEPITTIALRMLTLAEENILLNGGQYRNGRFAGFYHLPELTTGANDRNTTAVIGRADLIADAFAAGVTITPNASVARYDQATDRGNLYTTIDGITDNSHTGLKPYSTFLSDPQARPQQDWYELVFSAPVRFEQLVFYEGDITWSKVNAYYRTDQPRGGFFADLMVQVRRDGHYVEPLAVSMSPELDPFVMYQTITFDFVPIVGDAIRIVGTPGGTAGFTTILELEVGGQLYAGPQLLGVTPDDAQASPAHIRKLALRFSEPVALDLPAIALNSLPDGTPVDLTQASLLWSTSGRDAVIHLPSGLPGGAYEMHLTCTAIRDDLDLPLLDDDADQSDGLRTTSFALQPLDGTRPNTRNP